MLNWLLKLGKSLYDSVAEHFARRLVDGAITFVSDASRWLRYQFGFYKKTISFSFNSLYGRVMQKYLLEHHPEKISVDERDDEKFMVGPNSNIKIWSEYSIFPVLIRLDNYMFTVCFPWDDMTINQLTNNTEPDGWYFDSSGACCGLVPPTEPLYISELPILLTIVGAFLRDKSRRQLSILLHGPPGTGKSTIARHVAHRFGLDLCVSAEGVLKQTVHRMPPFVCLYDEVDLLMKTPDNAAKLLRVIDDAPIVRRAVVFYTTNYLKNVDARLRRAGRADVTIKIGPVGVEAALQIAADHRAAQAAAGRGLSEEADRELVEAVAEAAAGGKLTAATLKTALRSTDVIIDVGDPLAAFRLAISTGVEVYDEWAQMICS